MTTTRQIYLDNFEKLPESELARLAGVSRQRIHQLETQLHVCKMAPSLKPNLGHHCIDCGKRIGGNKRCRPCSFKARKPKLIILVCPTCEAKFPIDKKVHAWKLKHGQKEFFCSRKCLGAQAGKKLWEQKPYKIH